jgi:hypothetical protein
MPRRLADLVCETRASRPPLYVPFLGTSPRAHTDRPTSETKPQASLRISIKISFIIGLKKLEIGRGGYSDERHPRLLRGVMRGLETRINAAQLVRPIRATCFSKRSKSRRQNVLKNSLA